MNFFRSLVRKLFGTQASSRKARSSPRFQGMDALKARRPEVEALEDRFLPSSTSSTCLPTANTSSNQQSCNTSNYLASFNTSNYLTTCNTSSNANSSSNNATNCNTGTNQANCASSNTQVNCNTSSSQANCNSTTTNNQTGCTTTTTTTTNNNCGCGETISGYVFYDANNNGLMDSGEQGLANAPIELLNNATDQVIGTTTTNSCGYYSFDQDDSVSTAVQSITKTLTFPATQTNYSLSGLVDQFDPSLGTLVSVSITNAGSITSDIRAENTSSNSGSFIAGNVSGSLVLTGPNGLAVNTSVSQYAGTFYATPYDGELDFAGTSGDDFGSRTASGSQTITLSGSALAAFIGTGSVQLTESATATSQASGGGNVLVGISSTACAQVNVVYNYIPNNCLKPGNYTVVKLADPSGYTPGKESSQGVVLNTTPGSNTIPVTLTNGNSCNNDFGELKYSSVSGTVYADISPGGFNDGIMEADEAGIAGVTITLTGTNAQGAVSMTTTTNSNGFYQFNNLQPGNYTITETSPGGWVDGKDTAGTAGGTVTQDMISNINLPGGTKSVNNNFAELQFAQVSGTVYYDANDNGNLDPGEAGISGVTVLLNGTDFNGNNVSMSTITNSNGQYAFNNLTPGTYAVTDVQPTAYLAGKNSLGNAGGQLTAGGFASVFASPGGAGQFYNFGEVLPSKLSGYVYVDTSNNGYNDGIKETGEQGISGVTITLTGTSDQGSVSLQTTTDVNGLYCFSGLRPGTYTVTETPPAGYIDGKDTLGTITTGVVGKDTLSNITLPSNTIDPNNNFAELSPSVKVYATPPVIPGITPGTPVFSTPAIPVVSKAQLLSSTVNKISTVTLENAQFTNAVYTSILGRSVDATSLSNWLNYLQSGGTRQNLVATVWNSSEHRGDEVRALYQAILGATPSQATVNSYINMFNSGASEFAVAAAIAGSSQGTALYPSISAFVNQLYEVAMGRTASPSEQTTWASFVGSRADLAAAIFMLPEAQTDVIQQVYSKVLNRAASTNEVNQWLPQLQGGAGLTSLVSTLFASSAFSGRMTI
jgi:hypothetical protein